MSRRPGCPFCAIAAGEAPASVVYQDQHCIGLMDLHPIRPGHLLVIPRRHAVHLHELREEERTHLFAVAMRLMEAQRASGVAWEGGNVMVNDGPAAGQHVPHVHIHLLPRVRGDRFRVLGSFLRRFAGRFGRGADRAALDALAERIRGGLG